MRYDNDMSENVTVEGIHYEIIHLFSLLCSNREFAGYIGGQFLD